MRSPRWLYCSMSFSFLEGCRLCLHIFQIEQCFNLSSSQNSTLPVKEDRSTDTCSEEGNKDNASRKMRFSAAEVLERILVDEDACSVTAGETASNVSASEAKPCGVWLELPVLIKGFKF